MYIINLPAIYNLQYMYVCMLSLICFARMDTIAILPVHFNFYTTIIFGQSGHILKHYYLESLKKTRLKICW